MSRLHQYLTGKIEPPKNKAQKQEKPPDTAVSDEVFLRTMGLLMRGRKRMK